MRARWSASAAASTRGFSSLTMRLLPARVRPCSRTRASNTNSASGRADSTSAVTAAGPSGTGVLTRAAFANAIRANAAIGGSTNAVIHLLAIAGRLGVPLSLDDWDELGSRLPCLVNLQPSGQYLMEDFCYAGGLPVVMKEIAEHLHKDIIT